ncbi:hypothetical protein GQ44DRAFT_618844 [Phaeosphaeriaceae sp. PMI808]|nr:hypothetical protein GQ44DRAFT_618844 [Phaeosphaeriaceae sp. PMI808]
METITNAASTVTSTVSSLIYGQPAKKNETAGQEPISGKQGKGTVNDPFDKGNTEHDPITTPRLLTNQTLATSADATSKSDDFLKLRPAVGEAKATEPTTATKTGAVGDSAMPIVPLNPDTATSNTATSSATGITDKAGVSDKVWKPTELDQVKPEGAPGAGPSAPAVTPASPETSSTPIKASENHGVDAVKDDKASDAVQASSALKKSSVGNEQIDVILSSTPKAEHSVPDTEANDPHSKMTDKTMHHTDASKDRDTDNVSDLTTDSTVRKSESSKSAEPSSPGSGDEKSGGKMSHLKEKLKDKLHIGSKDK